MTPAPAAPPRPTLEHLPLPLLAAPLGIAGVGLAWRSAHETLGAPFLIGEALLALSVLVWIGVVGLQAARLLRHPDAMAAELRHPVRIAFVAAPTIALMAVGAFFHPYAPGLGVAVWAVASALHLVVAMLLLRRIVDGRGELAMLTPPLMIPLVGNVLAPVFGARMGFPDVSWMLFGVGVLLWLMVMPLLLHRLIVGPPLPPPLKPSLVVLLAPPAIAALAMVALAGEPGGPALAFGGVAILVAAVLLALAGEIARTPFGLAWWATTFPTSAFAAMLIVQGFWAPLCWAALLLTTGLTGWVSWRTAMAARAGVFFRPEG